MTTALINLEKLDFEFFEDQAKAEAKAEKNDLFIVRTADDLSHLTGPQMVSLYNKTVSTLNSLENLGLQPVSRFATKEAGVKRLSANLSDLYKASVKAAAQPEKKSRPTEGNPHKRTKGVNLNPKKTVYACRAGSKQAKIIDMLSRASGASFAELHEAMTSAEFAHLKPWQEITTRSALNWDVNKVKGYGIRTSYRPNGEAVYHLTYPAGVTAPLPHTPRKS